MPSTGLSERAYRVTAVLGDRFRFSRCRAAVEAFCSPTHEKWVVVREMKPLGYRIVEQRGTWRAAQDVAQSLRSDGGRYRVMTLWEHRRRQTALLETSTPWRTVAHMGADLAHYKADAAVRRGEFLRSAVDGQREHVAQWDVGPRVEVNVTMKDEMSAPIADFAERLNNPAAARLADALAEYMAEVKERLPEAMEPVLLKGETVTIPGSKTVVPQQDNGEHGQ